MSLARALSGAMALLVSPGALAGIDPHARVCVLVFTRAHGVTTAAYSCDGAPPEPLPLVKGRSLMEEQSGALKLFAEKMFVARSCAAVNTPDNPNKTYQLTCVLYP